MQALRNNQAGDFAPAEQQLNTFFKQVWPNSEYILYLSTRVPVTNAFSNHLVSIENAMSIAIREANAGRDVYYAPSAFNTNDNRKAGNVACVQSFWMDVDVGPEKAQAGTGYDTPEEADTALIRFCNVAGLPSPTHVVRTGSGGFHAYWVLDKSISPALWQVLAQKLKEIARHLNFLADPSRTADIASLMRVPGTFNYKYTPPRPVVLIKSTDTPIKLCAIAEAITAAHARLLTTDNQQRCNGNNQCYGSEFPVLKAILNCLDPDMIYADWFRVAAAMFNHTEGRDFAYDLFDAWSSEGQKYKGRKDTLKLWRSLRLDHPRPIKIGTLRMMVEQAGYDWQKDVVERAQNAGGEE
ncbi:MAG: PriCT-2 domain-containing protein [Gammaproteobacteria bacterium]|nr:PriCT-2 domain-containing protein [Gammaproteobacteria bacterium]MDP2346380.1 PriCT-2 domain-containing protein [Gammaproteobacteria bacterium]